MKNLLDIWLTPAVGQETYKMNVNISFQKAKSLELQLGLCQKDSKPTWMSSSWLKMEPLGQEYKRITVTEWNMNMLIDEGEIIPEQISLVKTFEEG